MPKKVSLQIRHFFTIMTLLAVSLTWPGCMDGIPSLTHRTQKVIKNQREADSLKAMKLVHTMKREYIDSVVRAKILRDSLVVDSLEILKKAP